MIDITQYLQNIYEDFKNYIENDVCLCKFKGLSFEAGALPDYTDVNIQQLYLLRYAFAYAFEYYIMYKKVLSIMDNINHILVTSVGCGSMIDYWALIHALEMIKADNSIVRYEGIDEIDWNYKIPQREKDEVYNITGNAKDYFIHNDKFVSDVYFFPKSISEFSDDEIKVIADSFSSKEIVKEKFFVCISLREDQGSMDRDMQKTKQIIDAIERNGYKTNCSYNQYTYFKKNDGIKAYDSHFDYPSDALEYIKNLNTKCLNYLTFEANCKSDCENYLDRCPILKVGHIRYQVIMFERTNQ